MNIYNKKLANPSVWRSPQAPNILNKEPSKTDVLIDNIYAKIGKNMKKEEQHLKLVNAQMFKIMTCVNDATKDGATGCMWILRNKDRQLADDVITHLRTRLFEVYEIIEEDETIIEILWTHF